MPKSKAVIFIDAENIFLHPTTDDPEERLEKFGSHLSIINHYLQQRWAVEETRAYGHWNGYPLPEEAYKIAEDYVYTIVETDSKVADTDLVAEIMHFAWKHPKIRNFVLVSGDGDFAHAIELLQKENRYVTCIYFNWGMSKKLEATASEFVSIERLMMEQRTSDEDWKAIIRLMHELEREWSPFPRYIGPSLFRNAIYKYTEQEYEWANYLISEGISRTNILAEEIVRIFRWENKIDTAYRLNRDHPFVSRVLYPIRFNKIRERNDGALSPLPGYKWETGSDSDTRVRWSPGKEHSDYPDVIASETEGLWKPAFGYKWVSEDAGGMREDTKDIMVVWSPGKRDKERPNIIACNEEDEWAPAPGYDWASKDEDDFRVEREVSR